MFQNNQEEFRQWLIKEKGLSDRVAGDTISRCRRLNKEVIGSIDRSVSSTESYLSALREIGAYSIKNKEKYSSQYTLGSSLRVALKKYCEFINPTTHKNYPNIYSIRHDNVN